MAALSVDRNRCTECFEEENMKCGPRYSLILGMLCVFCVGLGSLVLAFVRVRATFSDPETDALAQAELVSIVSSLELGSGEEEVRKVIDKGQSKLLRLFVSEPSSAEEDGVWRISTPLNFGAGNWIAILLFRDHRLCACIIRLYDNDNFKPRDAPPDRVREGYAVPNTYRMKQEY